jgi:hypothetical protein
MRTPATQADAVWRDDSLPNSIDSFISHARCILYIRNCQTIARTRKPFVFGKVFSVAARSLQ